ALDDDLGLDVRRVLGADLVLVGGRDQDVALELQELLVADLLGAGEARERAALFVVRPDREHVEALRVVNAALDVRDRDDLRPGLVAEAGRDRADVAEALDDDPGALELEAALGRDLAADEHQAAAGRLDAAA